MPESATARKPQAEQKQGTEVSIHAEAPDWAPFLGIRSELSVEVPLPRFRVGDLAQLRAQTVIASQWRTEEDVPLRINGTLIAWGEFEVVRGRLALRVTELR